MLQCLHFVQTFLQVLCAQLRSRTFCLHASSLQGEGDPFLSFCRGSSVAPEILTDDHDSHCEQVPYTAQKRFAPFVLTFCTCAASAAAASIGTTGTATSQSLRSVSHLSVCVFLNLLLCSCNRCSYGQSIATCDHCGVRAGYGDPGRKTCSARNRHSTPLL